MRDAPHTQALPSPDDVLATYERMARGFAETRLRTLFERPWLDRALAHAPGRDVLDLGCGTGLPIAAYLADRRCEVTGVDGAIAMITLFEKALPRARAVHADMRDLALEERFDLILAWNSFFHLAPEDQRRMFAVFQAHANPRAVLMFTSGPEAGEVAGTVDGAPIYHASLAPGEYRALLSDHGFETLAFAPEDPSCNGHTIWLARARADA